MKEYTKPEILNATLKASLTLSGQSGSVESAAYIITAGAAVLENSTIATDSSSYISGSDMVITVTLKDAASNLVIGQAASLTGVSVPNATLKPETDWIDHGDGTYTTIYVAQTASSGLVATLSLNDQSGNTQSAAYAVLPGAAVLANSSITTDSNTYVSGSDITVTVTLRDAANNAVTGQSSALTGVTVQNASLKSGTDWTDNGDGTYTAIYVAQTAGYALAASLYLSGQTGNAESAPYAIRVPDPEPVTITGVEVNGYTFAPDAGFPRTGFNGATFKLLLSNNRPEDFIWTTNMSASTVSVVDGRVKLHSSKTGNPITITGTSPGGDSVITYTFKLDSWFHAIQGPISSDDAKRRCSGDYTLPTMRELVGTVTRQRGEIGGLWSEWGSLNAYPEFVQDQEDNCSLYVWSSEEGDPQKGIYNAASLADGYFAIGGLISSLYYTAKIAL